MGAVVPFKKRRGACSVGENRPSVQSARAYLAGLKGRAYRFAWAAWRYATGKTRRRPRALRGRPELAAEINRAVAVAVGRSDAVATFRGMQERPGGKPPIELWNLVRSIPGHPAGSTVTRETIERAGFTLPARRNVPSWIDTPGGGFDDPEGASGEQDEPAEGDYTITGTRRGGEGVAEVGGRFLGEFPDVDAALRFIVDRMNKEQFFPNVWTVSDHGNANLVTSLPKPSRPRKGKGAAWDRIVGRRNPLSPCSYCGGPGGFVAGPDHSVGCLFYRKPRRVVRTISRRRPRENSGTGVGAGTFPKGHALHWSGADRSRAWCQVCSRYYDARNPGGWLYVNGVRYEIVGKEYDRQGELLLIRRPKGRKAYIARRFAPGDARGFIITGAGYATNPPRQRRGGARSDEVLIYPKAHYDKGAIVRGRHVSGGRYYHRFNTKTRFQTFGRRDGAIVHKGLNGVRLWGYR